MISIIVPVYNAEEYLHECIDSILNQSYTNIELILINDGSRDNSLQICKSYRDSRVIVIDKPNGGVSTARNKGLEIAKGEYIGFVDSDDTLPANALLLLYETIIKNKTDAIIGSFQYQYRNRFLPHAQRLNNGTYMFNDLLYDFIDDGTLSGFLIGSVCGGLYAKDIIQNCHIKFVEGLKNNEDGLFNFEFALYAKSITVISDIVYNYRMEAASTISLRKSENFGDKIFQYVDKLNWDKEIYNYEVQKKRRYVSLTWWHILHNFREYPWGKSIAFINNCLSQPNTRNGLQYMQVNRMNIYKKFFYYLMKYKLSCCMYISLKYLVPFLRKKIKR